MPNPAATPMAGTANAQIANGFPKHVQGSAIEPDELCREQRLIDEANEASAVADPGNGEVESVVFQSAP